jgi:hypothetical protein
MELFFKKIFIISVKLRFSKKYYKEHQSVAIECIKRRRIECPKHSGAILQEDFHCKCQVKVFGKGS